jgi:hypothetical protein
MTFLEFRTVEMLGEQLAQDHTKNQYRDLLREREVLTCQLLVRGYSVKEVSLLLNCSKQYVRLIEDRLRRSNGE